MKPKLLALLLTASLSLGLAACSKGNESEANAGPSPSTAASVSASASPSDTDKVPVERDYQGKLPQVSGEFGVSAAIAAGEGAEPTSIVAKTLKSGDGRAVHRDDFVSIHYAGALWDGTVFDSSFSSSADTPSKPVLFDLKHLIKGWQYGLEGQHVGDRVELVIPSEWGYGDKGQGKIPGGSTLVFAIDIVDAISGEDVSVLKQAAPTDDQLPAGISVTGALGQAPTVSLDASKELPSKAQQWTLAQGAGKEITGDDYVIMHVTTTEEGGMTSSSWDSGRAISSEQPVGNNSMLVGNRVGSRIVIYQPSAGSGQKAKVAVVDVLAATSSK